MHRETYFTKLPLNGLALNTVIYDHDYSTELLERTDDLTSMSLKEVINFLNQLEEQAAQFFQTATFTYQVPAWVPSEPRFFFYKETVYCHHGQLTLNRGRSVTILNLVSFIDGWATLSAVGMLESKSLPEMAATINKMMNGLTVIANNELSQNLKMTDVK